MGELWNRLTARQKRLFPWLALLLVVGSGLLLLQPSSPREAAGVPIQERPAEVPAGLEDSLARELTDILNAMLGGRRCAVFVTMDRGPKSMWPKMSRRKCAPGRRGLWKGGSLLRRSCCAVMRNAGKCL